MCKRLVKFFTVLFFMITSNTFVVAALIDGKGCTLESTSGILFGEKSSIALKTTPLISGSGNSGLKCVGLLNLLNLGKQFINVLVVADSSSGFLSNLNSIDSGTERINYSIAFAHSGKPNLEVKLGEPVDLVSKWDILTLGGKSGSIQMHVTLETEGLDLTPGIYRDKLSVLWSWDVCALGVLVCVIASEGSGTSIVNLALTVTPDCLISADDINFGDKVFVADFIPATGEMRIECSKNTTYSVGLNSGEQGIGNVRYMANTNDFIKYQIYKGSGSSFEVWGNQGGERRHSNSADSKENGMDIFKYNAQILPNQSEKPAGTYKDHIMIDITF